MLERRRAFLAAGGAAAVAVLSNAAGCSGPPPPASSPPPSRFPELEEATIGELSASMQRGELTARQLAERYLERIAAVDRQGPSLHAVLELNPEALDIASRLDDERSRKAPRGPLHGVPVLLKGNIDTGDRMQTTAGSLALAGAPAPSDAFLAARLRQAGAVILGKANLSEWANIRSDSSTSGWSALGGQTRNPYALDRNPSGSSSGSAAAVSANLVAAAIGTETDGSIVSPASICGIVGFKPTVGLVSRSGIIPISSAQDTAGPMTRTVHDAAILLTAMAGFDAADAATGALRDRPAVDYTRALELDGARGKRIGVVRGTGKVAKPVGAVFDAALEDLRRIGAELVDPVALGKAADVGDAELDVLLFDLKADMQAYLARRAGTTSLRTLDDLIRFNREHADRELVLFGQELFEQAAAKGGRESPAYVEALAKCRKLTREEGIDRVIREHKLDALVAPTGGLAWLTDPINGDSFTGSSSTLAAVAGYPSITVPAGQVHGLPVGISFFGGAFTESMLRRIAYAYEQATRRRIRPALLPTVTPKGA